MSLSALASHAGEVIKISRTVPYGPLEPGWLEFLPAFIQAKFKGRKNLKKITANMSWLVFDKVLRMGVGIIVGVWVARYLGPEQFGAFNFALAFVALFGALSSLGLDGIVVKYLVQEPAKKHAVLESVFVLKLCGGIIAFCSSLAVIWIIRPADTQTHWLVGILAAGMIFQAVDTIDLWYQSALRSKYTVYAKNGAFIVLSIIKVLLILSKAPLTAFAWAALAEIVLGSLFLTMYYRRHNHGVIIGQANLKWMKQLLVESWPLAAASIAIIVYMKIDQVMLGYMLGNKDVGIYASAVRFSEVWYFIAISISASVYPIMIEYKKKDEVLFYAKYKKLASLMAVLSITIAVFTTLLSNQIIQLFYGSMYSGAGSILSIHIWSLIFVFIAYPITIYIMVNGLQNLILITAIISAIANVLLNIYLIPKYGGRGAAIATVLAYAFGGYFSYFIFPQTRNAAMILTRSIIFP